MNQEPEEQLKELTAIVHKHDKIMWVVIALAIIFGLTGAWGAKMISKMTETIGKLNTEIQDLSKKVNKARDEFTVHVDDKIKQFDSFYQERKQSLRGEKGEPGPVKISTINTTFTELKTFHHECTGFEKLNITVCDSAIHRFCLGKNFVGGFNQEVNGDAVTVICLGPN